MTEFMRRRRATLACAALLLCTAVPAHAAFYELSWNWRWSTGSVIYDGSTVDGNADPLAGSFIAAIKSYDITGWELFEPTHIAGSSGSIASVATPPFDNGEGPQVGPLTLTFQFGALAMRDPTMWQISFAMPGHLDGALDRLPTFLQSDQPYGRLVLPSEGLSVNGISPDGLTVIRQIAPPVPEPETWLLMAIGLAGLAARRRFSAFFSPAEPPPADAPAR